MSGLARAAAGQQLFAGDPPRRVRGEEGHDIGDVFGLNRPPERGLGDDAGLEIRADEARAARAFRLDDAGVDGS
jgi:hypothetical protein